MNNVLPFPWVLRQYRLDSYVIERPGYMPHMNIGGSVPSNPLEARQNPQTDATAEFVLRACLNHGPLVAACMAALSQLTEDRPEYLESDVRQLREALDAATGHLPSGSALAWTPAGQKPPERELVLIVGVLVGEAEPGVHEGFWNGDSWESLRTSYVGGPGHSDGRGVLIEWVRGWMAKPPVPDLPVAEPGPRCPECDSDETERTGATARCGMCEASWVPGEHQPVTAQVGV